MRALFILVGILAIAFALLTAGGLSSARINPTLAAGSACGFAILGGLCFVAYGILTLASRKPPSGQSGRERDEE